MWRLIVLVAHKGRRDNITYWAKKGALWVVTRCMCLSISKPTPPSRCVSAYFKPSFSSSSTLPPYSCAASFAPPPSPWIPTPPPVQPPACPSAHLPTLTLAAVKYKILGVYRARRQIFWLHRVANERASQRLHKLQSSCLGSRVRARGGEFGKISVPRKCHLRPLTAVNMGGKLVNFRIKAFRDAD